VKLRLLFTFLTLGVGSFSQPLPKIRVSSLAEVAPLLIAGGEWTTQIVLTSYRTAAVTVPVSFFGQDGRPLSVPIVGMASATKIDITIPSLGTAFIETQRPTQSIVGWAIVDVPCAGVEACGDVLGQVILRNRAAGRPDYEAVFPFSERITSRLIMQFDNTAGFDTTLIVTNPENYSFSRPMTVTAAFYNSSGARIHLDQFTVPVAGNTFFSTSERYPQVRGQRGIIDLTATNGDLVAAGLRINPTNAFAPILAFEP
jgi:hypothetical protein